MAISEPNRKNQYDNALSRGRATSGAPTCRGTITLAKRIDDGGACISHISVPGMGNSWWCCSLVCNICMPGENNSARISSASTPARPKNVKDVMRYEYPRVLWSVVVNQLTTIRPFDLGTTCGCAGV